jgi:bifunctional non-homologous end joining protein LigD
VPAIARPTSPSGQGWLHEIKHDGFRIMARRDGAGVRLITRHGRSPHWLKIKNPSAPAVKREAEENWA